MLQTKSSLSIDGSIGEGGGQVLRTSLALALIIGRAFTLNNIRQRRLKPGFMAQHLKAVEAAREVGKVAIEGALCIGHHGQNGGALCFFPYPDALESNAAMPGNRVLQS